jgi:hypothetical protein
VTFGPKSPPMASTATFMFSSALFFCPFDHLPAFVITAFRAGTMGEFRASAVGAKRECGILESIVGSSFSFS